MKKKKFIFYVVFLSLLFIYTPVLSLKVSKDYKFPKIIGLVCEEVIEAPPVIYKSLSLKNIFVDIIDNGNTDIDDIYLSSRGGNNYILYLPKVANREKMKLFFDIKEDVKISAYDKDQTLLAKVKSGDEVDIFKYDKVVLKTDIQTKKTNTYNITVLQSDVGSVFINLNNGAKDLRAINNSVNHTTSRGGYSLVVDDKDNLTYEFIEAMRGRGNVTWKRDKKPYQIKYENKIDVFNMGKAKTYVLLNNYMDGSLSRNYLFLKLSRDIDIEYSAKAEPVDLYINNHYKGSYLFAEKQQVKKNRIETGVNDFLFEIENHETGNDYITTKHGVVITIKNPDFDDLTASERSQVKSEARAYLNKVENAIYNTSLSTEELKKYIDFDSFAKYYWLQEISLNYDAMRGSNYFYEKDGILHAGGGWDFDNSMERSYNYAGLSGHYVLDNSALNSRIHENWFRKLATRDDFSREMDRVYAKYHDVINNLPNELDIYRDKIEKTTKMNYVRWNYSAMQAHQLSHEQISGDTSYKASMRIFRSKLVTRTNYYKNEYKGIVYDSFSYEMDGKEYDCKDTNIIPSNYTGEIKIYGTYLGERSELKTFTMNNQEEKIELNYSKKTSSRYKKYVKMDYVFTFRKDN